VTKKRKPQAVFTPEVPPLAFKGIDLSDRTVTEVPNVKTRNGSAPKGNRREKQGQAPRPRIRQRRLMQNLLAGKNFTNAAIDAGYAPDTVDKRGTKLLRAEHWAVLLREAQLDDPTLAQRLNELVHAKSTRFFAHEGKVKDRRVVIDWDARAKGLDMAARIRGAYTRPGEEEESFGRGPVVAIRFILQGSARDSADNGKRVDGIQFRIAGPRPQRGDDLNPPPSGEEVGEGTGNPDRGAGPISAPRGLGSGGLGDHRCIDCLVQQNERGRLVQVCGRCGKPA
jgi:hypothetical protein